MRRGRHLDQVDMVRKLRQLRVRAKHPERLWRTVRCRCAGPVGLETELAVRMAETIDEMCGVEIGLDIQPFLPLQRVIADAIIDQDMVDMLALAEAETGSVGNPEPLSQFLDDEEIGADG